MEGIIDHAPMEGMLLGGVRIQNAVNGEQLQQ
jgi:hypothetical protein